MDVRSPPPGTLADSTEQSYSTASSRLIQYLIYAVCISCIAGLVLEIHYSNTTGKSVPSPHINHGIMLTRRGDFQKDKAAGSLNQNQKAFECLLKVRRAHQSGATVRAAQIFKTECFPYRRSVLVNIKGTNQDDRRNHLDFLSSAYSIKSRKIEKEQHDQDVISAVQTARNEGPPATQELNRTVPLAQQLALFRTVNIGTTTTPVVYMPPKHSPSWKAAALDLENRSPLPGMFAKGCHAGLNPISSEKECIDAAAELWLPNLTVIPSEASVQSNRPQGCYFDNITKALHFNKFGDSDLVDWKRFVICTFQPPADSRDVLVGTSVLNKDKRSKLYRRMVKLIAAANLSVAEYDLARNSWSYFDSNTSIQELKYAPTIRRESRHDIKKESTVKILPYHYLFPPKSKVYSVNGSSIDLSKSAALYQRHGRTLLEVTFSLGSANAVMYTARGDDPTDWYDDIQDDIDRVVRKKRQHFGLYGTTQFIFWLTGDRCYAPTPGSIAVGNTTSWDNVPGITIYSTNRCYDNIAGITTFAIPYPMGMGAQLDDNATTAGFRLHLERSFAQPRSVLAFFAGSEYTWPSRTLLHQLNVDEGHPHYNTSNAIKIEMPDWWGLAPNSSVGDAERDDMVKNMGSLMGQSIFALCPRGRGPSSMRLLESMSGGALPVLLDDWTLPFGDDMASFAIRFPLNSDFVTIVGDALRILAEDKAEIWRRRKMMEDFLLKHHPVWLCASHIANHIASLAKSSYS